jgi:arylsulfatase A-like enzyme
MTYRNTRRDFLKTVGFAAGAVMLSPMATAAEKDPKPNIVYILADDMGYGDLGCYGQKTLTTPHIDKMAAEGMRFTQHYAGSTVCAPSRCVLMTGLHTGHARIRSNGGGVMGDADVTVATVLGKAGYRTGCVGKWGIGHPVPESNPNDCGFDHFYGYANMWHAHNFYPSFIVENGKRVALRNVQMPQFKRNKNGKNGAGVAVEKIDYVPDLVHKQALSFIERNKSRPFFLYYALNMPHANNEGGRVGRGMEVPDHGEYESKDWKTPEKGFASMMRRIDDYVGEVLARLKVLGLEKNTLVIFASDNGPHNEGHHSMKFFDSNGSLRGMKRDLYEGGVRVPTIARWSGRIKAGSLSKHVSGFQDIMPTLCELAGTPCPKVDGISMLPTLLGRTDSQKTHAHLYWEFGGQGGKQAVLLGKYKGIRLNTRKNPNGPIELYDISKDISEQTNLAGKNPKIVAEIAKIMKAQHVKPRK